ncbi:MAG: hypothetical protein EXR79_09195 [Myxococcales bacterium]|nr:hypothetical protein [Myxococcales bacterium]
MNLRRPQSAVALVLVVALGGGACGTATVHRVEAPDLAVRLTAGSRTYLYVTDDTNRFWRVRRSDVRDIDHPGNVLAAAAAPFLLAGLTLLGVSKATTRSQDATISYAIGTVYTALSLPVFAVGFCSWAGSTAATDDVSEDDARWPHAVPGSTQNAPGSIDEPGSTAESASTK